MKLKNILTVIFAAAVFSACSLEEDTSTFANSKSFYKNEQQCRAALNSCYIPMKDLYSYKMMLATECATDLAYSRSSTQDAQLDISPANPRFGADVWNNGYKGIRYCNEAITGIEGSNLDEKVKAPLAAEGKIMRAFYYWLMTSFFGDIPFYTEAVADEATLAKVAKLPRMSADSTRAWLIKDLQECLPSLPLKRSSEIADNRVGAAVGYMLIAKMAQWNKEWKVSLDACRKIEEIYGSLDQYPLSDIPFRMKNTTTTAFLGPKFWCPDMQSNHDHNNYKIFRYADVLLMIAEAHCMLQDDMDAALKYLNMTKIRAGIRLYDKHTWKRIREEIMAERGRELFGEFQRKFDLVRWGTWYERTESETRSVALKTNILPCHRYYPIPAVQVAYSGYALDNKEYEQYGVQ